MSKKDGMYLTGVANGTTLILFLKYIHQKHKTIHLNVPFISR